MALPLRKKALIRTERLELKPYSMADADALAACEKLGEALK